MGAGPGLRAAERAPVGGQKTAAAVLRQAGAGMGVHSPRAACHACVRCRPRPPPTPGPRPASPRPPPPRAPSQTCDTSFIDAMDGSDLFFFREGLGLAGVEDKLPNPGDVSVTLLAPTNGAWTRFFWNQGGWGGGD